MKRIASAQRGFSLISALFLLLVLGALGTYMVSISGTQHFTALYALQGAKAYYAARSGIEWETARVVGPTGSAANCGAGTVNPGSYLTGFTVTISCTSSAHSENGGATTYNVYYIDAFAETTTPGFGQPGYASRRLTVSVTDAP